LRSTEEIREHKDVEARKVQKLGSSSLFVTLPKKWINKWNIKPGDKVIVEVDSKGVLKLVAEKVKMSNGKRSIWIDVDSAKQGIQNVVSCLYSLGYDEVILESKKSLSQNEMEQVTNSIKQINGLEITEVSSNRVKVECLLDTEKISEESLLRRMLNIVARQIDDFASLVTSRKVSDNSGLNEELTRIYTMLSRRILGKTSTSETQQVRDQIVMSTASTLLSISSIVRNALAAVESSNEEKVREVVKEVLQKVNNILDEAVMVLIFPSVKRVSNAFNLIHEARQALQQIHDMYIKLVVSSLIDILEVTVKNSSCVIYLEDFPWLERKFL